MPGKNLKESSSFVYRCGLYRVYQPSAVHDGVKKNPCPDCHFCQQCSEARCQACRGPARITPRLSFAEQIALFESLNAQTWSEKAHHNPTVSYRPEENQRTEDASGS